MKFFLDTANLDEIKKYASYGMLDGVTTNPSLVAKEKGVSFEKRIKEILKVVKGPVSVEVTAMDTKGMVREGEKFSKWGKNVVVKIPMTFEGLAAVQVLSKQKIKTNVTLIFSASQALLAAKAGATFISPFVGRLDDISQDGMELVWDIMEILSQYDFKTEGIVASVRHPRHVVDAAKMGAHICTIPPEIMEKLVKHPLTDSGLEKFLKDWQSVKK